MDSATKRIIDQNKELLDALDAESGVETPNPDAQAAAASLELYEKWTIPLNPTQREAFDNTEAKYILMDGERASGKCTHVDALLYASDRIVRIGELNPGVRSGFSPMSVSVHTLLGGSVATSTTDMFYKEPNRDAIEIELEHGGLLTGSPNHPIWCCSSVEGSRPTFGFYKLKEILDSRSSGRRFWTPIFKHPGITRSDSEYVCGIEITDDVSYLLGALCGDGSCNKAFDRGVWFTNMDREVLDRVSRALLSINCRLTKTSHPQTFGVNGKNIKMLLVASGNDCTSYTKRIPSFIVRSKKSVLCSFLRGLFDTDGTTEKTGSITLCTTSRMLSLDVQEALIALGIFCVRRSRKSASGRPTWTLSVFGIHTVEFASAVGFEIGRKANRVSTKKHYHKNRYGYPQTIKSELRRVSSLESRPSIKTKQCDVKPKKRCGRRVTSWIINRAMPWGLEYHSFRNEQEAIECAELINRRRDELERLHLRDRAWHAKNRRIRQSFLYVPMRSKLDEFVSMFGSSEEIEQYKISETWVEVVGAKRTEADLCDISVPETRNFLCSGIVNHNTIGCLHMLVDHCFNEDGALAIIIVEVTSMAEEGGAWHKLNHEVLPWWKENIKLFYTEPRLHPTSRKPFIWILNRHGTYSRVICLSMPVDTNVEDRVKGMEPSFVMVDEAQTLKSPKYFTAIVQQVGRRPNILGIQRIVYCCNPDGPSHWLYKRFFELPIDQETGEWNEDYARYHIPISENVANLPDGYYDRVIEAVRGDPVEYARMVRGEWIDRPTGRAIFCDIWSEQIHVKGDASSNTGIIPVAGFPILVGYDLGPAHSSIHFEQCLPLQNGSVWIVFDEINLVDQFTPYHKIVPKVLSRMTYWDEKAGGGKKFAYDHIADSSAFNQLRADGSYDVFVFQKVSEELGRPLRLRPAPKGPGSVAERVRMTMDMLRQGEILVSATCTKTREMFRMLESKPAGKEYEPDIGLKPRRSPHLHVFDSMTYPIISIRTGFSSYNVDENDARISFFG